MDNKEIKKKVYNKIKYLTEQNEDWMRLSIKNWDEGGKEEYLKAKVSLKRRYAYFVEYLDKKFNLKDKKILDLGCGFGQHSFSLCEKKARVFSLDIEKEFVHIVNLKKRIHKDSKDIFCIAGNGFYLPFKNCVFDGVICTHTIEHIKEPLKFLKEIYRVLKNNGFLYLTLPNYLLPYEPHFRALNLSFLSKKTMKIYLKYFYYRERLKKIKKRWEDIPFLDEFLNELNFILPFSLEKLLLKAGFKKITEIGLFEEEKKGSFLKGKLKKILFLLKLYPFELRFIAFKS